MASISFCGTWGGICLTNDLYVEVLWVPTWANPSDAPSRREGLACWRLKAGVAARAVLGSLLEDSEHHDAARIAADKAYESNQHWQPDNIFNFGGKLPENQ